MRFGVLALDYDGTIAFNGQLNEKVREAIEDARSRGIVVVLVTGRILNDLKTFLTDLEIFDSIVAENGAVVFHPASGRSALLGETPPIDFIMELQRRGIEIKVGDCVVEADAREAESIVSVVRDLELPLALHFNRGRLMVLPLSISKATGLKEALAALRLSPHNALAIGDAENDHEMLSACEIGVTVEWGSLRLKEIADDIIGGNNLESVAEYIQQITSELRLPQIKQVRNFLPLGTKEDGTQLSLAVRGRNVLISGDSNSGKSWVAGLLCENLILQNYSVCVIDPEGDYSALEALPNVITIGGQNELPPALHNVTQLLQHHDTSVVVNLSKVQFTEKLIYVSQLLRMLATLRRETGLPHRIVLDEAHYFLHGENVLELFDLDAAGYTLVTYRASQLRSEVLAASEAIIVSRETNDKEIASLLEMQKIDVEQADYAAWKKELKNLAIDEAVLFPGIEESGNKLRKFKIAPRLTTHVRHRHKYSEVPISPDKAFVFTFNNRPTGQKARTLGEFTRLLESIKKPVLTGHLERGDFSLWVRKVFGDLTLSLQIKELEQKYRQHHSSPEESQKEITEIIEHRYSLG